jgi:alpha-galactosidase
VRQLKDGSRALVLFNRSLQPATMSVSAKEAGLEDSDDLGARDLWRGMDLTAVGGRYAAKVPSHGVAMIFIAKRRLP